MIKFKKNLKSSYILVFFMIYFSFQSMGSRIYKISPIIPIAYFGIMILYFAFDGINKIHLKNSLNISSEAILIYMILLINIMLTMILNQDYTKGYYVLIMSVTIGLIFSTLISKNKFYNLYIDIMVSISIFSLICTYIILPVFNSVKNILPIYINEHGVEYINMIFTTPIINEGFYRNTGIYSEPGMFQVFLTFAVIAELFLVNREVNIKNSIILFITMITTFSPAAYMQAIILVLAYIIKTKNRTERFKSKKLIKKIFLLLVIIFIIIILSPQINNFFFESISKLFESGSSLKGRSSAIFANILAGLKSPLIGKGITNGFSYVNEVFLSNITDSNTSTTTAIFLVFGALSVICITYMQFKLIFSSKSGFLANFLVFLVFIITINSQLLIYDQMFYIICFSCYMKKNDCSIDVLEKVT